MTKLFSFFLFCQERSYGLEMETGPSVAKTEHRIRQYLQMLNAVILCSHNEIRGLVTPTTTAGENEVTTDIKLSNCMYRLNRLSLLWGSFEVLFVLVLSMLLCFCFCVIR